MTNTVTSADGTAIAFDKAGSGAPLILVVGAFNTRAATAPLAAALQGQFTTINYDRRGRGDSGDTPPYSVEREIEDLDALITEAGGSSAVFGYSSGANLALAAAASDSSITKLALYEPPLLIDESYPQPPADLAHQLADLTAAGRRGEAVELYQLKAIGMPEEVVARMRDAPFRPALEAIAHTLAYDAALIGERSLPAEVIGSIVTPTIVIEGEKSHPVMREAAQAVAESLPNGQLCTLAGQTHDISPEATAGVVEGFLAS